MEEAWWRVQELASVTNGAAQDTDQHRSPTLVGGNGAVSECNRDAPNVIRDHPVGHIHAVGIVSANLE
jgi:hypothetical protein